MRSFLKKKLQRLVVLRGTFVPWKVAPYFRSKRVQAGLIMRSLLLPSVLCMTGYFFMDNSLLAGGRLDDLLRSLPQEQMANLFIVLLSLSIIIGTLIMGLVTHLVGRLIEVPEMALRKSFAISGWAVLCSFVLSVPLALLTTILDVGDLASWIQFAVIYVYVGYGWRYSCGAQARHVITLGVLIVFVFLMTTLAYK